MRLTVKPFFPVVNPQRRKGFPGSLRILYRSTLTAKRVKIEVGTVVRYNVTRVLHIISLLFQMLSENEKRFSIFKWLNYSVTVRRSDNANEKKMFFGFLRRFLLATMVYKTKRFPTTAAATIKM